MTLAVKESAEKRKFMIMEELKILNEFNAFSVIVRLLLAIVLGALLGIERERKQRPAGIRTYTLVCLGAALAAVTNVYICTLYPGTDPSRIPAQIVSGIGFLGAGTILVTKVHQVKGLTTAAGLWCCAAVGIAVGAGFYYGAIIAGVMVVISLRVFSYVDRNFIKYNKYMNFYTEYNSKRFIRELISFAKKSGYQVLDLEITRDSDNTYFATFQLKITNPELRTLVLASVQGLPGCTLAEEV